MRPPTKIHKRRDVVASTCPPTSPTAPAPHADAAEVSRLRDLARKHHDADTLASTGDTDVQISPADLAAMCAVIDSIDGPSDPPMASEHPIVIAGVYLGALRRERLYGRRGDR